MRHSASGPCVGSAYPPTQAPSSRSGEVRSGDCELPAGHRAGGRARCLPPARVRRYAEHLLPLTMSPLAPWGLLRNRGEAIARCGCGERLPRRGFARRTKMEDRRGYAPRAAATGGRQRIVAGQARAYLPAELYPQSTNSLLVPRRLARNRRSATGRSGRNGHRRMPESPRSPGGVAPQNCGRRDARPEGGPVNCLRANPVGRRRATCVRRSMFRRACR